MESIQTFLLRIFAAQLLFVLLLLFLSVTVEPVKVDERVDDLEDLLAVIFNARHITVEEIEVGECRQLFLKRVHTSIPPS